MIQSGVELPIDDVAGFPVRVDRKGSFSSFEKGGHVFDATVIDVGIEFALWIKVHVATFMFDDEFLEIEVD